MTLNDQFHRRMLQRVQFPDRPTGDLARAGVRVAAVHGFMGRRHMQSHLLRYLRDSGLPDTTMYGHLHSIDAIASDLETAHADGRAIAILGYSQGGFHAVKVARELERRNVAVPLLVTIAAGGLGRALPAQWLFDHRKIPGNVGLCLNYFAEGDVFGSDSDYQSNLAIASHPAQRIENHVFAKADGITHIELAKCYPPFKVHPEVRERLLARLLAEVVALQAPTPT